MKTRDNKSFDTLEEIVQYLGDPQRAGKASTWVAKNYSLSQLIKDLTDIVRPEVPVWTTAEGNRIRVAHMSDEHILNAQKWLLEDEQVSLTDICNGRSVGYWVNVFKKEMNKRANETGGEYHE